MPILEYLQPIVVPFMLVLTRIAGLFLFTPLLTSAVVPRVYKALFALMFSVAIFPRAVAIGVPAGVVADLPTLGVVLFTELLVGVVIGMVAGLPIAALQMGGYIMGYQMGLGLAQAYNPEMDGSDDVVSQLLFYMGITAYIAAGGLDLVFITLLSSFEHIPIGSFAATQVPLDLYVNLLSSGLQLAVRVAAPVMGVIILALLAMGFIMKTMPQINILSVGFAAKIMAGLFILTVAAGSIEIVLRDDMLQSLEHLLGWVESFGQS